MQRYREEIFLGTARPLISRLRHTIERISELPKPKQRFVIEMLETVLAQASR